jgi:hypothetical protein
MKAIHDFTGKKSELCMKTDVIYFLTAKSMKMAVVWVVALCSLVEVY